MSEKRYEPCNPHSKDFTPSALDPKDREDYYRGRVLARSRQRYPSGASEYMKRGWTDGWFVDNDPENR